MGGLTFRTPGKDGEPALDTPRMPPAAYVRLREKYLELLCGKFYQRVACPTESPEKDSYGDIDIVVEGPRFSFTVQDLSCALGARRYHYDAANPTVNFNFAVPDTEGGGGGEEGEGEGEGAVVVYRQLDVHVCKPGTLDWEVFTKSYGDMWSIIGSMGRFYGLTVNDTGCHVRIGEIETDNRKRALLLLTRDPTQTLLLFGLDPCRHAQGFGSVDEMFDYCASTRFFRHAAFEDLGEKHKDRRRVAQRPVFRRWVLEYLPTRADVLVRSPELSREAVLEEVLRTFSKQAEYDALVSEWRASVAEAELWKKVAAVVPLNGEKLNLVVRGLKKIFAAGDAAVVFESDADGVLAEARERVTRPDGALDEVRLLEWVAMNWERVKVEERSRVKREKRERQAGREGVATTESGG
ncbi:MAG: hypothetical protein M1839_003921 [Geoglossum umbratile]|nr:MAG: hypothetical protein M1839_003921 [Geoglossum umbratile]